MAYENSHMDFTYETVYEAWNKYQESGDPNLYRYFKNDPKTYGKMRGRFIKHGLYTQTRICQTKKEQAVKRKAYARLYYNEYRRTHKAQFRTYNKTYWSKQILQGQPDVPN